MTKRLKKFISLEMSLNDAGEKQNTRSFAAKMVFVSIILSVLVSCAAIAVGDYFNLLPLPLYEALAYSVVMAWIVGGLVTGMLCSILSKALRKLHDSHAEFERLSKTDTLSGLANRRAFNQCFEEVLDDASLAIFDLDRFKGINDSYGHAAGDVVIKKAAAAIADVFGEFHCVARLGGEEFAVIVRGGLLKDRLIMIELARIRVSCLTITFDAHRVQTTVSVGVADIDPSRSKHDTFAAADKALYLAKASGRNCVRHETDLALAQAVGDLKATLLAAS
ncbi:MULTISPECIES: GGDEF domain-containing protein [unclassified Rhizobium]|uniref:GGDEF domain-containing protein n=1 Tax=unclassified Rhizobium TaxID=2613769 RepID=UPI00177CBB8D|nr:MULTISPECIES: GGDEF domain-containing protein [unclassified Rhizobium]MBD8686694.1 diguanylate cyclase [Rhizobium sp. CFBP 13644]MBD8691504.1 diguanylate cyclase [Rhizobium sp. CFBP 13717]